MLHNQKILSFRPTFALLALALSVSGCDWGVFSRISEAAPVQVIEAPGSYSRRGDFGAVLATYSSVEAGRTISRLAVSGGAASSTTIFPIFDGVALGLDPLYGICEFGDECGTNKGAALAGVAQIGTSKMCVITGAARGLRSNTGGPVDDRVIVHCESGDSHVVGTSSLRRDGPATGGETLFGAALASVPSDVVINSGGERLRVFVGAPLLGGGGVGVAPGGLYALRENAATVLEVVPLFTDVISDNIKHVGEHLAIAPYDADHTLLIASANNQSTGASSGGRVTAVVFSVINAEGVAVVHACLDGDPRVPQTELAAGDLNGDGLPEIVVTDGIAASTVRIYDGRGIPESQAPAGTCPAWNPVNDVGSQSLTLACQTVDGIECLGGGFGSSVAIADLNADGFNELIVGAPFAAVGEVPGAGVVYVYPGSRGGVGALDPILLKNSDPLENGGLGSALAAFESAPGRFELVATEHGAGEPHLFVFLCTGLGGDSPSPGSPQCLMTSSTTMSDAGGLTDSGPRLDAGL